MQSTHFTIYKVDISTPSETQKFPSMKDSKETQKRPSIKIDPQKESATNNDSISDAVEESIKSTDSSRKSSFSSRSYSPNLENSNQLLEVQRKYFLSNDPILPKLFLKETIFCFLISSFLKRKLNVEACKCLMEILNSV